jgi:hypothetical protein
LITYINICWIKSSKLKKELEALSKSGYAAVDYWLYQQIINYTFYSSCGSVFFWMKAIIGIVVVIVALER